MHEWNRDGRWQDVEDVFRAAAHDTECPELVKEGNDWITHPFFRGLQIYKCNSYLTKIYHF